MAGLFNKLLNMKRSIGKGRLMVDGRFGHIISCLFWHLSLGNMLICMSAGMLLCFAHSTKNLADTMTRYLPVLLVSKLNNVFFGYFDPEVIFSDNESKSFSG